MKIINRVLWFVRSFVENVRCTVQELRSLNLEDWYNAGAEDPANYPLPAKGSNGQGSRPSTQPEPGSPRDRPST